MEASRAGGVGVGLWTVVVAVMSSAMSSSSIETINSFGMWECTLDMR
jgi:hypothetical protein